jgi:glutamate/tyrosine decarboxylase-like PLP-dependent enzyme
LHVDAAWGGLAVMVPELRPLLQGIERADSITFDAHKGLSVPMSAGLYLTRHPHLLAETCRVTADYMPHDADGLDVVDPFVHSMQWSRRFIGLKVLLSLGVAGWDGYAGMLRHQVKMGNVLRKRLGDHDWLIVNETPLPVVCFTDGSGKITAGGSDAIASAVVKSGSAWISTTRLDEQTFVLRACITNFRSTEHDIDVLIAALDHARDTYTSPRDNQLEEL